MRNVGQATRPAAKAVAILATVLAICAGTSAAQPKRLDVNTLLDLYARGDYTAALADYEKAEDVFTETEARPNQARVLRDWGNALRESGNRAAGDEKLGSALALFEAVGLAREANEVREALAQTA